MTQIENTKQTVYTVRSFNADIQLLLSKQTTYIVRSNDSDKRAMLTKHIVYIVRHDVNPFFDVDTMDVM